MMPGLETLEDRGLNGLGTCVLCGRGLHGGERPVGTGLGCGSKGLARPLLWGVLLRGRLAKAVVDEPGRGLPHSRNACCRGIPCVGRLTIRSCNIDRRLAPRLQLRLLILLLIQLLRLMFDVRVQFGIVHNPFAR